eukprot:TRINITY_DN3055_c0_g1_i2.p2 TRINITY_DN3055_c0_g1~~TRINITY_DN3055_c0_g1_i2.p2  ORF type:complete len:131 (-),score=41.74 TRINITY_DN3055_c0_g1_i2:67-459(-)
MPLTSDLNSINSETLYSTPPAHPSTFPLEYSHSTSFPEHSTVVPLFSPRAAVKPPPTYENIELQTQGFLQNQEHFFAASEVRSPSASPMNDDGREAPSSLDSSLPSSATSPPLSDSNSISSELLSRDVVQ